MKSEAEKQAELLLLRLKELEDWQASTELKIKEQQKQEMTKTFHIQTQLMGDTNDTEDDTVSSMEYDREDENYVCNESANTEKEQNKKNPVSFDDILFLKKSLNMQDLEEPKPTPEDEDNKIVPKPYLKRGSGLARFNLPTDLNHLPYRKRKQRPNIKNISSKYTQETKAFASRKAEVRTSRENLKTPSAPESIGPASGAKMFRPRSSKNVSSSKMSPVLKQILSKKVERQSSACDSVEHSFKEKLSIQSKHNDKEEKELEVFEMLEGATLHSSFSSTNSAITSLLKKSILTSPSNSEQKQNIQISKKEVEENNSDDEESSTNPSIGDTLMNDIDSFLHKSGIQQKIDRFDSKHDDESVSEASTIINEDNSEESLDNDDVVMQINGNCSNYNSNMYLDKNGDQDEQNTMHQVSILKLRIMELESEVEKYREGQEKVKFLETQVETLKQTLNINKSSFKEECDELTSQTNKTREKLASATSYNRKPIDCTECKKLRAEKEKLNEKLSEKEEKLKAVLLQLNTNISKAKKDKIALQNENHRMRIKYAKSIVGQMLQSSKSTPNLFNEVKESTKSEFINNGDDPVLDNFNEKQNEDKRHIEKFPSDEENTLNHPETKTTLEFSPADSLESSMSLVSAGISQSQISLMSQRPATSSTMSSSSTEVTEVIVNAEKGTREKRFKDGSVEIWYSNGNRKEINVDGSIVTVYYYNGDMKETHKNGLIKYLYNDSNTWHTKYPDGRELTQFSNGQTEERNVDGSISIVFPDGTTKHVSRAGTENITFPDKTVVIVKTNGSRIVKMPNNNEKHFNRQKFLIK